MKKLTWILAILAIISACWALSVGVKNWLLVTSDQSMPMGMIDEPTLVPTTDVATATALPSATATATALPSATVVLPTATTVVKAKPASKPAAPVVKVVTQVVVATAAPTAVPVAVEVDLKSLDLSSILKALSDKGMVVYNRQIFGDSWVAPNGAVTGSLPAGYNILVLSGDSASFSNGEVSFSQAPEGFLAIVVTNSPNFVIDNISYNAENQHKNVSGYALKANATGAELTSFALNLAAYEWSKEHKPFLYFFANGKLVKAGANVVKDMNSEQELRSVISSMVGN